jgi:hypothetical protein
MGESSVKVPTCCTENTDDILSVVGSLDTTKCHKTLLVCVEKTDRVITTPAAARHRSLT